MAMIPGAAVYVVGASVVLVVLIYGLLAVLSPTLPTPAASESTYRAASDRTTSKPLPSLVDDAATVELTVVVPAYNEAKRIATMLRETITFLESDERLHSDQAVVLPKGVTRGSYEILVVDDGSRDNTAELVLSLAGGNEGKLPKTSRGEVKVVQLVRNRGKGGATRHGVLHAAGHHILFCDADGASHFPDLQLLEAELRRVTAAQKRAPEKAHGVIVGSRAHLVRTEAVVKRSFLRNLLMRAFHTYLWILGIRAIRDTQCGFKLFPRASARILWPSLHSPSWIFDCELLLLASLSGIPIREVGIQWHEVDGSKVDLVRDSIGMAVDLLVIRANYALGRWKKPERVGVESAQEGDAAVEEQKKDR